MNQKNFDVKMVKSSEHSQTSWHLGQNVANADHFYCIQHKFDMNDFKFKYLFNLDIAINDKIANNITYKIINWGI